MTITYANTVGSYKLYSKPVKRRGGILQCLPGQGDDGYGRKITTDHVLVFSDSSHQHRVYATCFSNAASCWIKRQGKVLHLTSCEEVEKGPPPA